MRCRVLSAMSIALVLPACGPVETLKQGLAHSQAVSESLAKTLGAKPFVGFNRSNGVLDSVRVTFQAIPADATLPDIVATSRQAIATECKQAPSQVVVSFALKA